MAAARSDFATPMECCLDEGLSVLHGAAAQLGADRVAVILVENCGSVCVVYQWPDIGSGEHDRVALTAVLEPWRGPVSARSTIGQFLNRKALRPADSFLLVPWPGEDLKVAIAFGFVSGEPDQFNIPKETSAILRLAALATWNTFENRRLRRDLSVVSERLGRRKIVERAKGLLQARHGWTEPQAYEHLRRVSRQRRKTMAETAEAVLRAPPTT